MTTPRYNCFAGVLPNNQLMVVGGHTGRDYTNSVELATIAQCVTVICYLGYKSKSNGIMYNMCAYYFFCVVYEICIRQVSDLADHDERP